MQCMVCATELLRPANFCPVCGARLAAPSTDGSAATEPGNEPSGVVLSMPETPTQENVVYLPNTAETGAIAPHPRANDYASADAVPDPYVPGTAPQQHEHTSAPSEPSPAGSAAQLAASMQHDLGHGPLHAVPPAVATSGSHGALPSAEQLVPPPVVDTNPFGDFFADGPSAWLEDDDEASEDDVTISRPRILGSFLAGASISLLIAAWSVWGAGIYRGAGGAESAPILLLATMTWIWYLSLPREQQHRALLRRNAALQRLVDERIVPMHRRTEGSIAVRRERDRYRAMRDERERRVLALGEAAQRSFRHGTLPPELHAPAQRVLAIERQMLVQDARIHELVTERDEPSTLPASDGSASATLPPGSGHPAP